MLMYLQGYECLLGAVFIQGVGVMGLYNFLSSVALSNICPFTLQSTTCSAIHLYTRSVGRLFGTYLCLACHQYVQWVSNSTKLNSTRTHKEKTIPIIYPRNVSVFFQVYLKLHRYSHVQRKRILFLKTKSTWATQSVNHVSSRKFRLCYYKIETWWSNG